MSIVIVGITPEYVITMSDGRVVGQNGKILNESFKKIYRFNPYICVGITGCMDFFQELFTKIDKISLNRNETRTDQLIQTIYELSKEIKLNDSISGNSSIVVCGVNTYNKMESIGFSTKNFVINKQNVEKNGLALQVLCNYPNSFQIAQKNILKHKNLIIGMRETIKYISTVYPKVNNKIFTERIDL